MEREEKAEGGGVRCPGCPTKGRGQKGVKKSKRRKFLYLAKKREREVGSLFFVPSSPWVKWK